MLGSANEDCKEAVNNAEEVDSCPTSKEEWDIAARKKNCSKLAAETEGKQCTVEGKKPEYHCLINPFKNKFLEVCVVAKTIFGNVDFLLLIFSWRLCYQKIYIIHKICL